MKIKTLDLFAGIGGMRIASEKAAKSLKLQHECVVALIYIFDKAERDQDPPRS